jgi:hypothetical protein
MQIGPQSWFQPLGKQSKQYSLKYTTAEFLGWIFQTHFFRNFAIRFEAFRKTLAKILTPPSLWEFPFKVVIPFYIQPHHREPLVQEFRRTSPLNIAQIIGWHEIAEQIHNRILSLNQLLAEYKQQYNCWTDKNHNRIMRSRIKILLK